MGDGKACFVNFLALAFCVLVIIFSVVALVIPGGVATETSSYYGGFLTGSVKYGFFEICVDGSIDGFNVPADYCESYVGEVFCDDLSPVSAFLGIDCDKLPAAVITSIVGMVITVITLILYICARCCKCCCQCSCFLWVPPVFMIIAMIAVIVTFQFVNEFVKDLNGNQVGASVDKGHSYWLAVMSLVSAILAVLFYFYSAWLARETSRNVPFQQMQNTPTNVKVEVVSINSAPQGAEPRPYFAMPFSQQHMSQPPYEMGTPSQWSQPNVQSFNSYSQGQNQTINQGPFTPQPGMHMQQQPFPQMQQQPFPQMQQQPFPQMQQQPQQPFSQSQVQHEKPQFQ